MTNKQDIVNENMIELFQLDKESVNLENNQIEPKKKKGRGGPRPNSGRKPGSTNKITATLLLNEIAKHDIPFEEGLAIDYARARSQGDLHIVQRYQQMFLGKLVADKQEMDITSNGQTIGASFNFPQTELPEWNNDKPTTH